MKIKLPESINNEFAEILATVPISARRAIAKGVRAVVADDFNLDSLCSLEREKYTVLVPVSDPVVLLRDQTDPAFSWFILVDKRFDSLPAEEKWAWMLYVLASAFIVTKDARFWPDDSRYRREAFLLAAMWASKVDVPRATVTFLLDQVAEASCDLQYEERATYRASHIA